MSIKKLQRYDVLPGWDLTDPTGDHCRSEDVAELEATNAELVKALEGALKMLEGIYESPNVEGASLFVGGNDIVDIQEALASARGDNHDT